MEMLARRTLGAGAALALLGVPRAWAAPVAVTTYPDFVEFVGLGADYGTGRRFGRETFVLFHAEGVCDPDFARHGMSLYGEHEDLYALVSVDLDHASQGLLAMLGVETSVARETCPGVVVKARSLVDAPAVQRLGKDSSMTFDVAVRRTQSAHVAVTNEMPFPVDVLWSFGGSEPKPTHIKNLKWGWGEQAMSTFKLTELVAVNSETREPVASLLVRGHSVFTVADRECTAETCGTSEAAPLQMDEKSVKGRATGNRDRENQIRDQTAQLPSFTEVGFARRRVPDEAWDIIKTFYEENKGRQRKEMWNANNVYTNDVEAPSYMVPLPEGPVLKSRIHDDIRPILEEWSGVELVQTATYGVRAYQNTSWLANHVDRRDTHAVSVIINVDQDVEKDWPLMIYDHAGNSYNITMRPRDMVLYESAICTHGRPTPLQGAFYANMFIHFKPTDPQRWDVHLAPA